MRFAAGSDAHPKAGYLIVELGVILLPGKEAQHHPGIVGDIISGRNYLGMAGDFIPESWAASAGIRMRMGR